MRIDLLLKREPFAEIVERTLTRYLLDTRGESYSILWNPARRADRPVRGGQVWHANHLLNFFATSDTHAECFEVVRNEYANSLRQRRRALQRAYVRMATSHRGMPLLCHSRLVMSPPLPDAEEMILLGGNHRLRLLLPGRKTTVVILKDGFPERYVRRECDVRRKWPCPCSPALLNIAPDTRWFSEAYRPGTPVNRLPAGRARVLMAQCLSDLEKHVHFPSLQQVPTSEYLDGLLDRIRRYRPRIAAPGPRAREMRATVPVCETHGDFQPANVLGSEASDASAVLIDWEFANRRFALYDHLTCSLGARISVPVMEQRIRWFLAGRTLPDIDLDAPRASLGLARENPVFIIRLFLLEELMTTLEQPYPGERAEKLTSLLDHLP